MNQHKPGRWASYDIMGDIGTLPRIAGVYAVYVGGELVYVGQSGNIANRFSEHNFRYGYGKNIITPWGNYPQDTPMVLKIKRSVRRGDYAMWEIRLIHRLQPCFNKMHRGRKAA